MITENSFFKNIPTVIDLRQRLILEGAGWAIQMISHSYERLKLAASQVDAASGNYPTSLATEMFACCWSIIDQCHMLRKILERLNPASDGLAAKFIKTFEAASLIRNEMDHLHEKINNIASKKAPMPPLFGALSFAFVGNDDISVSSAGGPVVLTGLKLVTLTAGPLTHPQHRFQVVSPPGRLTEIPVGLFQFVAFEHRVDFSDMMRDLAAVVSHFDTDVKSDQERQLRAFARENSLDEEKVLAEHFGAFIVTVEIEFPAEEERH